MNQISLYSGIEGFGLAGQWLGWNLIASVENDKACQIIIKKNFPNTVIYGDIYKQSFKKYCGQIGIVTGGFPCQKFSLAGEGSMDLSEWREMLRAVCEIKPVWVVVENVYGLVVRKNGVALEVVCTDLENEGFEVFPPYILPACSIGANHQRDRVWVVAYSDGFRQQNIRTTGSNTPYRPFDKNTAHRTGTGRSAEGYGKSRVTWSTGFPEPTIYGMVDGIPGRVERIKQYGNAIVPQVFYEIGDVINTMNEKIKKMQQRPFKTYNGGKNGSGVYQAIINQIPPHEIFISGFAGNCGVLANIKRAPKASFAIDLDKKVTEAWLKIPCITAINGDAISTLKKLVGNENKIEIVPAVNKFFIFLDPPYLPSTRKSQADLYDFEMKDPETHKKLLRYAKEIPFPVLISHYPCKIYDDALKGWRTVDIQGRTRRGMRTERLYMNYPEPAALHDYRYIGNDYREREMYKKAKKNMIEKFNRMTDLERNFIAHELKAKNLI